MMHQHTSPLDNGAGRGAHAKAYATLTGRETSSFPLPPSHARMTARSNLEPPARHVMPPRPVASQHTPSKAQEGSTSLPVRRKRPREAIDEDAVAQFLTVGAWNDVRDARGHPRRPESPFPNFSRALRRAEQVLGLAHGPRAILPMPWSDLEALTSPTPQPTDDGADDDEGALTSASATHRSFDTSAVSAPMLGYASTTSSSPASSSDWDGSQCESDTTTDEDDVDGGGAETHRAEKGGTKRVTRSVTVATTKWNDVNAQVGAFLRDGRWNNLPYPTSQEVHQAANTVFEALGSSPANPIIWTDLAEMTAEAGDAGDGDVRWPMLVNGPHAPPCVSGDGEARNNKRPRQGLKTSTNRSSSNCASCVVEVGIDIA